MREPHPRFAAVLVMAGSGERLGAGVPKAFVLLAGRPLWRHSAEVLAATPGCTDLVLVVPPGTDPADVAGAVGGIVPQVVPGGARRQDSVAAGLAVLAQDQGSGIVAVHDAARPLVTAEVVTAVVAAAARVGAAVAAEPAHDTVKRAAPSGGLVDATLDRSGIWLAQTPQAFRLDLLVRAHWAVRPDDAPATDDAMLVERLGEPVALVPGGRWNLKVTMPEDLDVAAALLASRGTEIDPCPT